ncbi:hypothetical protein, partial [Bifidobacterium longum]|uniref:hypothetical protein n=1 Tax=Bifidobacterium longum TaxID=216816 RepID=UPI0019D3452E
IRDLTARAGRCGIDFIHSLYAAMIRPQSHRFNEGNNMQAKYFLIRYDYYFYLGYLPMPRI